MRHLPLLLALFAVGCYGERGQKPSSNLPPLPAHFVSETPLEGAQDVKAVRGAVQDGQPVILRGTLADFGALATFKLVEDSLAYCGEGNPDDDHCKTPWDYCCEDPSALRDYTVQVEFLDGDMPGAWRLSGQHGLDRLKEVAVAGTLKVDERGNMRLLADRVALQ